MTTGFVERLAAARIGDTFNQYAELRAPAGASRPLPARTAAGTDPARRRGSRLPRRTRLRHSVHVRAPAVRGRPGRGDRHDRPSGAGRARAPGRPPVGTSCPPIRARRRRTGLRPERDRAVGSVSFRARGRAARRRDRPARACPPRRPVRSPPVARRRCRLSLRPRRGAAGIGSGGGALPGPPQHDPARRDADVALRDGPARRRRRHGHARARDEHRGDPRARPGDLPHRRRSGGAPRRAPDGPVRPCSRARRRLRRRDRRLPDDGARLRSSTRRRS